VYEVVKGRERVVEVVKGREVVDSSAGARVRRLLVVETAPSWSDALKRARVQRLSKRGRENAARDEVQRPRGERTTVAVGGAELSARARACVLRGAGGSCAASSRIDRGGGCRPKSLGSEPSLTRMRW